MRLCALYLHERADREDIMQETFLRYAQHDAPFAGEEHKRAWLLRVATNLCKDLLKSAAARNESLDSLREDTQYDVEDESADDGSAALERSELMAALRSLEDKYRLVLRGTRPRRSPSCSVCRKTRCTPISRVARRC